MVSLNLSGNRSAAHQSVRCLTRMKDILKGLLACLRPAQTKEAAVASASVSAPAFTHCHRCVSRRHLLGSGRDHSMAVQMPFSVPAKFSRGGDAEKPKARLF